jgi:hypothetical protein
VESILAFLLSTVGIVEIIQVGEEVTEKNTGGNVMGGLPVEMITMLGSSLLGGMMSIWGQSIKAKQEEQKMLMERANFQMKSIESARTYDNKGFQWTRRIIALTAVFFIIAWPKLVPVLFDVPVILTWTEFTNGFLFLIDKKEILLDREFLGLVITPLDTHLMSAIVGLYFGGSLVKK